MSIKRIIEEKISQILHESETGYHVAKHKHIVWGIGKTPDEALEDAHNHIDNYVADRLSNTRSTKIADRHWNTGERYKKELTTHPATKHHAKKYI